MRGVAILLVVLCHMAGTFFEGRVVYFTPLGGIGVAIFLMLSAYGLNESYIKHGLTNWWKKRLMAVWIPYFIIECSLYWPFHDWNFLAFFKDITFLRPLYQNGWYLNYLAVCYIMFYLIIRHGEKMYETLLTNEECAKAVDMGNFYRVPADNRGLNYDKYFKDGDNKRNTLTEFNSNNTTRLNLEETKAKIAALAYIQEELEKME